MKIDASVRSFPRIPRLYLFILIDIIVNINFFASHSMKLEVFWITFMLLCYYAIFIFIVYPLHFITLVFYYLALIFFIGYRILPHSVNLLPYIHLLLSLLIWLLSSSTDFMHSLFLSLIFIYISPLTPSLPISPLACSFPLLFTPISCT